MPLQIKNLTLTDEEYKLVQESLELVEGLLSTAVIKSSADCETGKTSKLKLKLLNSIKVKLIFSAKLT